MVVKPIVQRDAPVLRKIAESVAPEDITSPKIQKILSEMKAALDSQEDGVAIAAPQIGYQLRIFVVSDKVAEFIRKGKRKLSKEDREAEEETATLSHRIFINPVIKKISKEKQIVEEGCLSVRYLYGKVKRSKKTEVEAYDETGRKFTFGGTGIMAQIFQHEIDHLNGVLFIDKATDLEDIPPSYRENEK